MEHEDGHMRTGEDGSIDGLILCSSIFKRAWGQKHVDRSVEMGAWDARMGMEVYKWEHGDRSVEREYGIGV